METFITAIGTANPIHKRSQAYAADFIANLMGLSATKQKRLVTLYTNSGIDYRYTVLEDYTKEFQDFTFFPPSADFEPFPTTAARMDVYKKEAIELAISAVNNCLKNLSNFSLSKVTHLITVSCTGMYTPGIDIGLVKRLNLNSYTQRTAINFMGCYGAFIGLKTANAICKADPDATVLLVCVELCSLHVQKDQQLDNVFANLLFGDGAAAAIIQSEKTDTAALALEQFHNELIPDTNEEMAWHIGDTGFEMALSAYVPQIIKSGIAEFSEKILAKMNYKISDIDFFGIHPGGRKILEACETALGITARDNRYSYDVLRNYGNMSSCTMLFVIAAIIRDLGEQDHGKKILGLGFGPGLTLEAMLMRVT